MTLFSRRKQWYGFLYVLIQGAGSYSVLGPGAVLASWHAGEVDLTLTANLSDTLLLGDPQVGGETLWLEGNPTNPGSAPAWFVRWSITAT